MSAMSSPITGVSIVYPNVCSGVDQRKHQRSASLAFVRGIHRWPANCPHKGPVTRKMFPFDDVIMCIYCGMYYIRPLTINFNVQKWLWIMKLLFTLSEIPLSTYTATDKFNVRGLPVYTCINGLCYHWWKWLLVTYKWTGEWQIVIEFDEIGVVLHQGIPDIVLFDTDR